MMEDVHKDKKKERAGNWDWESDWLEISERSRFVGIPVECEHSMERLNEALRTYLKGDVTAFIKKAIEEEKRILVGKTRRRRTRGDSRVGRTIV